jgi:hypothetical protein
MTTIIVKPLEKQIKELDYQDDLNRLAKQRNDKELDEYCNTCKMYISIFTICYVFLYLVILIVQIISFRLSEDDNSNSY